MNLPTNQLRSEIQRQASALYEHAEALTQIGPVTLTHRPAPDKWNALECLEHLSLTYDHYLPRIEGALEKARARGWKAEAAFSPGFFGNQMVKGVRPGNDGSIGMKMKTFKSTRPAIEGQPASKVLKRFLTQHGRFMELLEDSKPLSLQRPRITSLIGPILRFRLGDAFRFLQAHNQRHWLQLQRAMEGAAVPVE